MNTSKEQNNQSFTQFLLHKFSHLQQYYKTEEEFRDHLLSGEVTMPVTDAIKFNNEWPSSPVCPTCQGYRFINPGLHEKPCPDCNASPVDAGEKNDQ